MSASSASSLPLRGTERPLAQLHDAVLLDLDGTVYVGADAVPGVRDVVAKLKGQGIACSYLTNNASRTAEEVARQLRGLGLPAEAADVVTSAQAAARLLAGELPPKSPVLVVGGLGLIDALQTAGLTPVRSIDDSPLAVVQGFAPEVGWTQLAEGAFGVAAGLPWIATNLDRTIPTPRGIAPGNGTLVEVIRLATGVEPRVAGKPERPLVDAALDRTGARRALVVGDRLDTDIACAVRAQLPSLLVLTGVTDTRVLLLAAEGQRPTYISAGPEGLLVVHPQIEQRADGAWTCGRWTATVEDGAVTVSAGAGPADAEPIDGLRAACAAAWSYADRTGTPPDVAAAAALGAGG